MKIFTISSFWVAVLLFLFSSCETDPFTTSGMADDHFFLSSGNQHMPVTVGGNVDSRKFLVIIHGGPGGNAIVYRDENIRQVIENSFAVVYWDQRFAGNTQGNGGDTDISAFREDIFKLLTLLRAEYGSDISIYLMGHSWGGFLAPYFLAEGSNQDLVSGWIQVGGAHNYRMKDSLTREMLLFYGNRELRSGRNTVDWQEIVDWCEDNGFEGRDNAGQLNGFAHTAESLMPEVTEPESFDSQVRIRQNAMMSQIANGFASGLRKIDDPTYTTPISDVLNRIEVPTLLLWGEYDFVCPPGLAVDIEERVGSDDVLKIIYSASGHSPMANEPAAFWRDVFAWIQQH